jgi:Tfp pilus assembly protein PilX
MHNKSTALNQTRKKMGFDAATSLTAAGENKVASASTVARKQGTISLTNHCWKIHGTRLVDSRIIRHGCHFHLTNCAMEAIAATSTLSQKIPTNHRHSLYILHC